jgi:hypothetical protein
LGVDLDRLVGNVEAVHPGVRHLLTSARTGEGVDALRDYLLGLPRRARAGAAA